MKAKRLALGGVVLVTLLGCLASRHHVTIEAHITLDIRQIKEQADDVLDYIEGKSDALPGVDASKPGGNTSWFENILEELSPIRLAYAEELKATSPRVTELAMKLRERHPQLEALKAQGCIGEDNRGYVEPRPSPALRNPNAKNEAQKLVAAENADRKDLYLEIVALNKDNPDVTLTVVERIYAQRRLDRAKSGEIFQLPPTGEDFDKFKSSPAGKQLGDACVPGGWVTIS
jgi:uncharacterized protein YdbL (DUF1318 family)